MKKKSKEPEIRKTINQPDPAIERNFSGGVINRIQIERMEIVRSKAKEFAYLIKDICKDGREKSLAMTKLEESLTWIKASIARDPK